MKKILLFFACCMFTTIHAEKDTNKFGKVTDEEVKMTGFPADTSAAAVVLYEKGRSYYTFQNNEFQVCFEIYEKIKILKPEGVDRANVEIHYYDKDARNREIIRDIDGNTYNFVNGKVEKSKLKSDFVFQDHLQGKWYRTKFTLPAVKPGSVIEYKYLIVSTDYSSIRTWGFQQSIPVCQSIYEVSIPEYFTFNKASHGYNPIAMEESSETMRFTYNYETQGAFGQTTRDRDDLECQCTVYTMKGQNLPAMKKDPYVSYLRDYMSSISFELAGIHFPGSLYKSYTYTWDDTEKELMNYEGFGSNLKQSGFFKEEVKTIAASQSTNVDKLKALLELVRSKVKWNEKNEVFTTELKKAIKTGIGSSADMNYLLISVLKDAGFAAYPVVMSRKSYGRLPFTNPSIDGINYFVTGVVADNKNYYMDASRKNAPINVLDEDCLVDRARMINPENSKSSDWVDLSHLTPTVNKNICMIHFDNDKMVVEVTSVKTDQSAYLFREEYKTYKNQDELVEALQNKHTITIENYSVKGLDTINQPIVERYTFTKPVVLSSALLYINPLTIFQEVSNPFKEQKRNLPVEFNFPQTERSVISIVVPEGYVIDEIPKSEKTAIKENSATYSYLIQKNDNTIQLVYTISRNQMLYPINEYEFLRDFWTRLVAKNSEQIVLKKNS